MSFTLRESVIREALDLGHQKGDMQFEALGCAATLLCHAPEAALLAIFSLETWPEAPLLCRAQAMLHTVHATEGQE